MIIHPPLRVIVKCSELSKVTVKIVMVEAYYEKKKIKSRAVEFLTLSRRGKLKIGVPVGVCVQQRWNAKS